MHPGDIEAALSACEAAMFPRGASACEDARDIVECCFGDRAPRGMLELVTGTDDTR